MDSQEPERTPFEAVSATTSRLQQVCTFDAHCALSLQHRTVLTVYSVTKLFSISQHPSSRTDGSALVSVW
jgi:hypothetical protein